MRFAVGVMAPNITLPIWARLFKGNVLPMVDRAWFVVGTPIREMADLAQECLSWADLELTSSYQSHGETLTRMARAVRADDTVLFIEDDCFVTCPPIVIDSCFHRVELVGGVLGSRMARTMETGPLIGPDTYGRGLYPNMLFAEPRMLGDLDFTSREGGDVGQLIGEWIHARGIHTKPEAHLPQCRLSRYPGCVQVVPETWDGPWLHVGEMSLPPRWTDQNAGGRTEASAAYKAALDSGEVRPGEMADRMRRHLGRGPLDAHREWFDRCYQLMGRVFT